MANPTALYSYQGQAPAPLPKKILLSDGRKRTDINSFTDEELLKSGYSGPYEVPNYDQEYQRILWNSETLSFVVEDISDEELWDKVRKERDNLLSKSDWTMFIDSSETLNYREWEMYRQRLRDLTNLYDSPKNVVFPESPEGKSDEDFEQPRVYEDRIIRRVRALEEEIKILNAKVFSESVGIASTDG